MNSLWVDFSYIGGRGELPFPGYHTPGAAGFDLYADEYHNLPVMQSLVIPTGYAFEIPPGYEGQIRGRSGLATRGIFAHVGTIDSDYRGEVKVVLFNLGDATLEINRGDRIAQMVIAPVVRATLRAVLMLSETVRGNGGFGSTGR